MAAHYFAQERRLDQQLDEENLRHRERMWQRVQAPLVGETGPEHRAFLKAGALGKTHGDVFQLDHVFTWPPLIVNGSLYAQDCTEGVSRLPTKGQHRRNHFSLPEREKEE